MMQNGPKKQELFSQVGPTFPALPYTVRKRSHQSSAMAARGSTQTL